MKKILLGVFMLSFILQFGYGEKYWSFSYKDRTGNYIKVDFYSHMEHKLYKTFSYYNKKDFLYKYIKLFRQGSEHFIRENILYYSNQKLSSGKFYYYKDSPLYITEEYRTYERNGNIEATVIYENHPVNTTKSTVIYAPNKTIIQQIDIFSGNKIGAVKRIWDYFDGNLTKVITFFKNSDSLFMEKEIIYYEPYGDKVINRKEQYYSKESPDYLTKQIAYYEKGVIEKQENYFSNHPKGYYKSIVFYKNEQVIKLFGYDKGGNVTYKWP